MVRERTLALTLIAALLLCGSAFGETLYKYRGEDGEWIYSDRPPADGGDAEAHSLTPRGERGGLNVTHSFTGIGLQFVTHNPPQLAALREFLPRGGTTSASPAQNDVAHASQRQKQIVQKPSDTSGWQDWELLD